MNRFGYTINRPRSIDLDSNDMSYARDLAREFPELETCVACGNCAATCTAGIFTPFSLRRVHTLVRRGEYAGMAAELNKCMLCGKCRLVCPRGINTRGIVQYMKNTIKREQKQTCLVLPSVSILRDQVAKNTIKREQKQTGTR